MPQPQAGRKMMHEQGFWRVRLEGHAQAPSNVPTIIDYPCRVVLGPDRKLSCRGSRDSGRSILNIEPALAAMIEVQETSNSMSLIETSASPPPESTNRPQSASPFNPPPLRSASRWHSMQYVA